MSLTSEDKAWIESLFAYFDRRLTRLESGTQAAFQRLEADIVSVHRRLEADIVSVRKALDVPDAQSRSDGASPPPAGGSGSEAPSRSIKKNEPPVFRQILTVLLFVVLFLLFVNWTP